MKAFSIVRQNLKSIYSHPYNQKRPIFAITRFFVYLTLKLLNISEVTLPAWQNRKILWYKDSIQSVWFLFNYIIDWEEFNLIRKSLNNDSIFIDVGSNIGYYSIWASKFNKHGKVYCFEPNETNFNRLLQNIQINNKVKNIVPIKMAVSKSSGTVVMTNDLDTLNHILSDKHGIDDRNLSKVACISLDDFVLKYSIENIDYLKIDVEGFEFDVLLGAKNLLEKNKIGIIQLEINRALEHSNYSTNMIVEFLQEFDYVLCGYDVKSKNLEKVQYSADRENYFVIHNNYFS